jgi:hypothetical protein
MLDLDPDEMNADPQPCLVGGGQARQQTDQRVLNVRVLAQLRVLRNAEHALADGFEFFLQRGQKRLILILHYCKINTTVLWFVSVSLLWIRYLTS